MSKLAKTFLVAGQIDPTAFRGLTNLVELDLSGNLLTSVPTPTFSGTDKSRQTSVARWPKIRPHNRKRWQNFPYVNWFKGG